MLKIQISVISNGKGVRITKAVVLQCVQFPPGARDAPAGG